MIQADSTLPKPLTDSERAALSERHAKAYMAIEPFICDVDNMATLTHEAVANCDDFNSSKSPAIFAVFHLVDMIRDLRKRYHEDDFEQAGKAVA